MRLGLSSNRTWRRILCGGGVIAVWERDAQYPTYNAFRSFLYNSVKNAGLNHLKHKNVEEKYLASLNLEDEGDDIDLKMMEEGIVSFAIQDDR